MKLTTDMLDQLINTPSPQFSRWDYCRGLRELEATSALLALIVYDYEQGEGYTNQDLVRNSIKRKLVPVLYQGKEPCFDNGHCWGYPVLCQAFSLIKNKASLWSMFSPQTQHRITVLMEMFIHMWNFGCNKYNGFQTGIGLHGNYKKNANPNYMLSNEALILPCVHFFGNMHECCQVMIHRPYEKIIQELKILGFKNAYRTWMTPGFELPDGTISAGARELFGEINKRRNTPGYWNYAYVKDVSGNIFTAGRGKGCTLPYYYKDRDFDAKDFESYPKEVYEHILAKTFSGGLCQDSIRIDVEQDFITSIKDGTNSPYLGFDGMMWEFNSWDFYGTRSSLFHSMIDFYLITTLLTTLKLLNVKLFDNESQKARIIIGMDDCLYKYFHGYIGYSMGQIENSDQIPKLNVWCSHWEELNEMLYND
jgi:hypothetical protein